MFQRNIKFDLSSKIINLKKEIKIYAFVLVALVVDDEDRINSTLSSSESLSVSMDSESSISINFGLSNDVVQVIGIFPFQDHSGTLSWDKSTVKDSTGLDGSSCDAGVHSGLDED